MTIIHIDQSPKYLTDVLKPAVKYCLQPGLRSSPSNNTLYLVFVQDWVRGHFLVWNSLPADLQHILDSSTFKTLAIKYNLVPAMGRCYVARKMTVGLAAHWPCVCQGLCGIAVFGLSGLWKGNDHRALPHITYECYLSPVSTTRVDGPS